jgi:hypothetical protein
MPVMKGFWGRPAWVLLPLAAVLIFAQFGFPPILGLANNGDFPKLLGRHSLGPVESEDTGTFAYVIQHYEINPKYFWESLHVSSERIPLAVAVQLFRWSGQQVFDIRIMGAIHAALLLTAFAVFFYRLRGERPLVQWMTGSLAVWIFTDIAYVSYLNSFYMDASAIVFLLILVALLAKAETQVAWVAATVAACLFVTAKSPHTPVALALAGYLAYSLWKRHRWLAIALPTALLVCAGIYGGMVPRYWKATAMFDVVFFHLLTHTDNVDATLAELNLDSSYAKYRGFTAYQPESPTPDDAWLERFYSHCSHSTLIRYYLRRPGLILTSFHHALTREAFQIRQLNLGNYTKSSGYPPAKNANSFNSWSAFRIRLYRLWPYHLVVWFFVFAFLYRKPLAVLLLAIAAIEFCMAALLGALETHRHLLIFHLVTDVTVLLAGFELTRRAARRLEQNSGLSTFNS